MFFRLPTRGSPAGRFAARTSRPGASGTLLNGPGLPPRVGRLIAAEPTEAGKARQICDWLAGLTDGMIVRTYQRLFDPELGSIRDLS